MSEQYKYYSTQSGSIRAILADSSQDHLITDGMTLLTDAQVYELLNPTPESVGLADAKRRMSEEYSQVMGLLSSKYTQQEINTFHRKSGAAEAYASGVATTQQIMYLAKIDGRINGELPATPAESEALYNQIQADPAQKAAFDEGVLSRANRVIQVSHTFDYYTGEIERLRDKRVLELSSTADNAPVVAALKADYDALTAAYIAAIAGQ